MDAILQAIIELRDLLSHHPLFPISALLIVGYFVGKLAGKIGLPEITGFILAGLLLSDAVTGIVPHHMEEGLTIITEIALGFIALTIGGEFYRTKLMRMGKEIVLITVIQIVATSGLVFLTLFLFKMPLPFALMLGAIASATAPAATVAIVQSLRAQGKFIDYLYGVVALDDAGCVVLFGIIFAIASGMLGGGSDIAMGGVIFHALGEVFFSLIVGGIGGLLIHFANLRKSNHNEMLIITFGLLLFTSAIAIVFHLSPLLTNMAAGAVIINMSPGNHRLFRLLEPLTPVIYGLFFVIAGTELQLHAFMQPEILLFGGIYILSRSIGKYGGVYLGCRVCGVEKEIRHNLGFCMLPQAGVAIGLVSLIKASPLISTLDPGQVVIIDNMVNIILLSVFVNEIIGPPLSKMAIIKGNRMEV